MENKFFGYINKLFIIFSFIFCNRDFLAKLNLWFIYPYQLIVLNIRKIINLFLSIKYHLFVLFFYSVLIISSLISQYISHSLESSALYFFYI